MLQELTVVITGSTGKQGGAVARGLLERGHKVRAVTRDTNSSQAKSLASAGATLVAASLEDTAALTQALEGATSPLRDDDAVGRHRRRDTTRLLRPPTRPRQQGRHLVFTSVGSANRQTGVPHFDSKYEVEKHIAKVGVRATILAPVAFMENLYFIKEQLAKGVYAAAASADKGASASCCSRYRGSRRSRPRGLRSIHREAFRPRKRRAPQVMTP